MVRSEAKPRKRLLKAFEVLDDATFAITKWAWRPVREGTESRFLYSAATNSPRVVGHVYHKVDCKSFPEISNDASKRCKHWKLDQQDDQKFAGFIEVKKNPALKKYSPCWIPETEMSVFFKSQRPKDIEDCLNSPEGFEVAIESAANEKQAVVPFNAIPMPSGTLAGYFFDELLFRAGNWWHRELSEIENLVNRK